MLFRSVYYDYFSPKQYAKKKPLKSPVKAVGLVYSGLLVSVRSIGFIGLGWFV